jgi:hypothetical protein
MVEKKDFFNNPLIKIIGAGFILSLVIALFFSSLIVFIFGINLFGLGVGLFSMFFLSGVIFSILMSLTLIFAVGYFVLRDVGKESQRTTSKSYSFNQQEEVGKKTQELN